MSHSNMSKETGLKCPVCGNTARFELTLCSVAIHSSSDLHIDRLIAEIGLDRVECWVGLDETGKFCHSGEPEEFGYDDQKGTTFGREMKHDIEEVQDGVWVHTKHPDTGHKVSIYVNYRGSSDGIIIDVWHSEEDMGPVYTVGLGWNDELAIEEDECQEPDSYEPLDHKHRD